MPGLFRPLPSMLPHLWLYRGPMELLGTGSCARQELLHFLPCCGVDPWSESSLGQGGPRPSSPGLAVGTSSPGALGHQSLLAQALLPIPVASASCPAESLPFLKCPIPPAVPSRLRWLSCKGDLPKGSMGSFVLQQVAAQLPALKPLFGAAASCLSFRFPEIPGVFHSCSF